MKALEVSVSGEVQGVGYRRVVQKLARALNLTGYVENQADGTVRIIVEGEGANVQKFLQGVAIKEPPIMVERLESKERRPVAKYKLFSIKPGSIVQELQEGLGSGEGQLALFRKDFNEYRSDFNDYREEFRGFAKRADDNFATLTHSYAEIGGKLTEVLETLKKESLETRREFTEALETLRKESLETRKELTRAVDNLSRLVEQYVKGQS